MCQYILLQFFFWGGGLSDLMQYWIQQGRIVRILKFCYWIYTFFTTKNYRWSPLPLGKFWLVSSVNLILILPFCVWLQTSMCCNLFLLIYDILYTLYTLQNVEACESMNGCLNCLAQEYPTVKFCKIRASDTSLSHKFVSYLLLLYMYVQWIILDKLFCIY